ncbi:hypothetical protein BX666DRAFT_1939964 [Dichotomocladium elegans]|nr:hypothetical protein BX666DRAFT_1939964 [Dichotomocladium elegans]
MHLHSKEKVRPPRNLRSVRRSLVKNQISTPISAPTPLQASMGAPKKIIKALYDYQAQRPHELSFERGDFFHVIGRENDEHWFEACNPATNSRGIVPVSYFQILDKSERNLHVAPPLPQLPQQQQQPPPSPQKMDSGFIESGSAGTSPTHHPSPLKKLQPLYGIVLYDFQAERSDELDAKAGEPIIVIAQSNVEWYVAKPIGRLGGPGLIPVAFVEVRDAVTGKPILQPPASIPAVEEWKKVTQGYEASSISAGSSISSAGSAGGPTALDDETHENNALHHHGLQSPSQALVKDASIESYVLEGDQYWFIVFARLNNGRFRVLYRLYEDFYDFQLNLLSEFPAEAGKDDHERILPYMPGPLTDVDEKITAERQQDLDKYCKELLNLPRYLAESTLVQNQLFGLHEGDIETEEDPHQPSPSKQPSAPIAPSASTPSPAIVSAAMTTTAGGMVKLKIAHKDDIFAVKVPANSTFEQLHEKVRDRLGFPVTLRYKGESAGESLPLDNEMDMEDAFASAVKLGKLTVYAERL